MKNKHFTFIISLLGLMLTLSANAQEVVSRSKFDDHMNLRHGLYNERLSKWVLTPQYDDMRNIGVYAGTSYFGAKKNNSWGVLDERGQIVVGFQFDDLMGGLNGFFECKMNGSWGVADVTNHIIIKCEYRFVNISSSGFSGKHWDSQKADDHYRMDELIAYREKIFENEKNAAARKAQEMREKIEHERKEKQLASFSQYANSFIDPYITRWKQKGEFEKMADYQARTTPEKIASLRDSLMKEAEIHFLQENAALNPEKKGMKLKQYDAENEVFYIESSVFGEMTVAVPISEAPSFKENSLRVAFKNPVYFIQNDKIALASLEFFNVKNQKTYKYINPAVPESSAKYSKTDLEQTKTNTDEKTTYTPFVNIAGKWKLDDQKIDNTIAKTTYHFIPDSKSNNQEYVSGIITVYNELTIIDNKTEYIYRYNYSGHYKYYGDSLETNMDYTTIHAEKGEIKGVRNRFTMAALLTPEDIVRIVKTSNEKLGKAYEKYGGAPRDQVVFSDNDTMILFELDPQKGETTSATFHRIK